MGLIFAISIILIWFFHLAFMFEYLYLDFNSVFTYLYILLQGYLYTGLFITAHDAIHGTASQSRMVNKIIGRLSSFLFAALSYKKLADNHKLHHQYPGTEKDPDFNVHS